LIGAFIRIIRDRIHEGRKRPTESRPSGTVRN
jgi:hypothetical protein